MRKAIPKTVRLAVYDKCNHRCAYCGIPLEYKQMQIDHATPLRIGGADDISNYMPACRSCNHYKATFDIEDYRKYLGGIHKRLMRDSIPYQVAERFGIVNHVSDDVTFCRHFGNIKRICSIIFHVKHGFLFGVNCRFVSVFRYAIM